MFEKMIRKFPRVRILVVGDIMLDRFIWGNVSRISPEAPVPVVVVEKETLLLGGAANVVNNINSLGGEVVLCGVVGEDEMGQKITKRLDEMGINCQGIFIDQDRQTTVKTRIIAHHQQLVRIDRETSEHLKTSLSRNFSEYLKRNIKHFDGLILSDYGKGLLTKRLIRETIEGAREAKKFVMVDPKTKNFFFYKGATVVTPNTAEASLASRISITDEMSLRRAGESLLRGLKCNALVITRGEDGMAIFEPDQKPHLVPTEAKEVYDVTGAGDTVISTLTLSLAGGATRHIGWDESAGLFTGRQVLLAEVKGDGVFTLFALGPPGTGTSHFAVHKGQLVVTIDAGV